MWTKQLANIDGHGVLFKSDKFVFSEFQYPKNPNSD